MLLWLCLLAALAGVLNPVQSGANAELGRVLGSPFGVVIVSLCISLAFALLANLLSRGGDAFDFGHVVGVGRRILRRDLSCFTAARRAAARSCGLYRHHGDRLGHRFGSAGPFRPSGLPAAHGQRWANHWSGAHDRRRESDCEVLEQPASKWTRAALGSQSIRGKVSLQNLLDRPDQLRGLEWL